MARRSWVGAGRVAPAGRALGAGWRRLWWPHPPLPPYGEEHRRRDLVPSPLPR